jgi:hypothetical protein
MPIIAKPMASFTAESQHEADEDQQQADGDECFAGMHGR